MASSPWLKLQKPLLYEILAREPATSRRHHLNLVCSEWDAVISESPKWKQCCEEAGIPPVSGETVDWHAHFISASKSRWTRKTMMRHILQNKNVLMTGPGGTGKTATINTLRSGLEDMDINVYVTALTAAAAELIGGMTLHRWAGVGLAKEPLDVLLRRLSGGSRQRIRETRVLVIDEISMCPRTLFEKLDAVCKNVRRSSMLFGGIQLVVSGDFYQLPPVPDRDVPGSDQFVFQSKTWETGIHSVFSFEHIYRSSDSNFSDLLLRARRGSLAPQDVQVLMARRADPLTEHRQKGITPTRMHCLRAEVDQFNRSQLAGIAARPRFFDMEISASPKNQKEDAHVHRPERQYAFRFERARRAAIVNSPVPQRTEFKTGAQVILIVNLDPDAGLVNGSRGVVTDAHHPRGVEVAFACGLTKVMTPHTWTRDRELGDGNEPITVEVKQIPLILGWATTVHRAQGMTLDCVEVDLGPNVFSPGMGYVALSRVRTLESLSFLNFHPKAVYCKPIVNDYYRYIQENGSHVGFLDQINKIRFPLPGRMQQLAAKLPQLTAQREAAREARREAEREAAVPAEDPKDLLAAYKSHLASQRNKRPRELTTSSSASAGASSSASAAAAAAAAGAAYDAFAEAAAETASDHKSRRLC